LRDSGAVYKCTDYYYYYYYRSFCRQSPRHIFGQGQGQGQRSKV